MALGICRVRCAHRCSIHFSTAHDTVATLNGPPRALYVVARYFCWYVVWDSASHTSLRYAVSRPKNHVGQHRPPFIQGDMHPICFLLNQPTQQYTHQPLSCSAIPRLVVPATANTLCGLTRRRYRAPAPLPLNAAAATTAEGAPTREIRRSSYGMTCVRATWFAVR